MPDEIIPPGEFRELLAMADMSAQYLAECVGINGRTARNWSAGKSNIPRSVGAWARRIRTELGPMPADAAERGDWRRRRDMLLEQFPSVARSGPGPAHGTWVEGFSR